MQMTLWRYDATPQRTFGRLALDDGAEQYCYTLEHGAGDSERIAAGRYEVVLYDSPHFGFEVPLLRAVPGHSMIEMHSGNTVGDSRGCILVGLDRMDNLLLESRAALGPLTAQIKAARHRSEEVWLTIVDGPAPDDVLPPTEG